MASAAGMEGMLVVLHSKKDGHEAAASGEKVQTAEPSKDEGVEVWYGPLIPASIDEEEVDLAGREGSIDEEEY